MDAVSKITGRKVDRKQVADVVKSDKKIRDGIKRGIHTHFIERGGTGGRVRSKNAEDRLKKLIDKIKIQEGKVTEEQKQQLRDSPGKAGVLDGKVVKTGNHELLPIKSIDEWKKLGLLEEHLHLRVDTRFAVYFIDMNRIPEEKKKEYESKDTGLQGHPISVFSEPSNRKKSQKTVGHHYMLHNLNLDEIKRCETKAEKQCVIIEYYLKPLQSTEKRLKAMGDKDPSLKNTFTATGHDLSKPHEKRSFLKGLSREIYKGEVIVQRIKGSNSLSLPGQDHYCKEIHGRVQNANNLEDVGRILMEPAPCGQISQSKKSKN
jgi:hypothetical protein